MISGADPDHLLSVGAALTEAAESLGSLGQELKSHAAHVHLEGEGGDAFREWIEEMAKQTDTMSDFAHGAGKNVTEAGVGLHKAKRSMPEPDTSPCTTDEEKEAKRRKKEKELKEEAVAAMISVSSYYGVARSSIGGMKEPKFPPPPASAAHFGDSETPYTTANPSYVGAGAGSSNGGAPQTYQAPSGGHGSSSNEIVSGTGSRSAALQPAVSPSPAPESHTSVDSVAPSHSDAMTGRDGPLSVNDPSHPSQQRFAPGPATVPPPTTKSPYNEPSRGAGPRTALPVGNGPGNARGGGASTAHGTPTFPRPGASDGSGALRDRPVMPPRGGSGDGVVGGTRRPAGGHPSSSPLSRGMVAGEENRAPGRMPMGPHTHTGGQPRSAGSGIGNGRRVASQPGGVVGNPGEHESRPGERLPQGTVVGEEEGAVGRGTTEAYGVRPTRENPSSTDLRGDRSATEPGHVAGAGRTGGAEFTPGGSGLVSEENAFSSNVAGRRGRRVRSEDEGAGQNQTGKRYTVPPVIK